MEGIKNFLFDLDGTISDPRQGITESVQYSLRMLGIDVPDAGSLTPFIGPPLVESYMNYYNFDREKALRAIGYYREYFEEKGIFENIVYKGIPELLFRLSDRGMNLFVLTFKPTVYSARIIGHFGLARCFRSIEGTDMSERVTSKVELIAGALEKFGLDKKETVMTGDRRHDIEGARGCGVTAVAAGYGYGSREELMAAGPDYYVPNVSGLASLLEGGLG